MQKLYIIIAIIVSIFLFLLHVFLQVPFVKIGIKGSLPKGLIPFALDHLHVPVGQIQPVHYNRDDVTVYGVDSTPWANILGEEMYGVSAFLDDRWGQPTVTVLVTLNTALDKLCHCRLWNVSESQEVWHIYTSVASYKITPEEKGRPLQYFLLCPVYDRLTSHTATHVDITCTYHTPTNHLLAIIHPSINLKYNFTMCLLPIFGNAITKDNLLEYLEVNRMLGADHFIFYDISKNARYYHPIISAYEKAGLLTVIHWYLPKNQTLHYNAQTMLLNDCLYRSRTQSRYIVNTDVDEIIVPFQQRSWMQLLEELNPRGKIHSFSFRNMIMSSQHQNKSSKAKHRMRSLHSFVPHFPINKHRVRSKFIADPQVATMAGVHYVTAGVPRSRVVVVPESMGLLFHYKGGKDQRTEITETAVFNAHRMLDFKEEIMDRIANGPYRESKGEDTLGHS